MKYIISLNLLILTLFSQDKVDFNKEIRPLLSDRCFACHGPDGGDYGEKWRGGLRLDTKEAALADINQIKYKAQLAKRTAEQKTITKETDF